MTKNEKIRHERLLNDLRNAQEELHSLRCRLGNLLDAAQEVFLLHGGYYGPPKPGEMDRAIAYLCTVHGGEDATQE